MLAIMRDVFDSERDEIAKSELLDELSDVLHRLGNLHASSAEHKQAMVCFSEVLDIQRRRNTDREELRIADLLFNMGNIYVELKRPEKALKCLEESFKMTKDALGESHPELHSTLYLMGVALWELDDYEGCVEWFAQALSVLNTETDEGVDDAAKGRTLYRLGRVYEELQNEPDALKCYQECTKILKSTRSNDFELSHALFALGKLLQHRSEYEEALNCYDQSLRMHIEMGNDASAVADIKECIGLTLDQINQTNRSLAYLADALRTKTKQEGIVSCNTGKALMYIGQNYLSQGQHHDLAKSYFDAALGTFEGDPNCALDTAVCLYSVGLIQDETSEDGCLENCTQAIQIFKAKSTQLSSGLQNYDRVFARSLHHVAKHYAQQKRCVEALEFMTEAYEVKTGILGAHHEETAESQHWLGIIHLALGDDELALHEFKAALKTRVSLFGTEHSAVAESLYGLAEVHFKRDELAECRECILENIRITDSLKSDVNIVSRSKLMMGSCYQELGQFDEAKENLAESLELLISAHGGDKHLDIAEAHFRLGICLCETKNYDSSMDHFKACATIRSSLLGDLDIECANTYESLGIVQQKSSLHDDAILSFEKALAIKRASLPEVDEDIAVLLSFIGTSLFAVEKFDEALHFFSSSADIKKELFGSMDQDYVMTLLDKASALTKVGDDKQAMECYSKSVESGGLPLDSWELGVAYKNMAKYFYEHDTFESSFDGYSEAVSIFEWIMENEQPVKSRYTDVIECYVRLLEMSDHPISDERGLTCYKLANCYVEASKLEGR
jgi:tetratricopeptide (TPR) repeat protein